MIAPLLLLCGSSMRWMYLTTVLLLAGCAERSLEVFPQELIHVWRTPTPGYADRYLEFRDGWVLFGTGKYTSSMHPVEEISSIEIPGGTQFNVEYRMIDGEIRLLELRLTTGNPSTLQVGQQPGSWIPEPRSDADDQRGTPG